jgi:putative (di)nucleoside polyphosphate hydrolase
MALTELSRYLPRHESRNRFLRGHARTRDAQATEPFAEVRPGVGFELPPGATFDPDPSKGQAATADVPPTS